MGKENKKKNVAEGETPSRVRGLHGAGGIDQLPSGRWRVRVRLPSGARVTEIVDTEHEANVLRAALVVERREMARRGELDAPGRAKAAEPVTLGEFGARWLDAREVAGAHRGIDTERSIWRVHIAKAPLATMALGEITRRDVRAWLRELVTKRALCAVPGQTSKPTTRTLSRSVLTHCLSLLRQCFAGAQEEELVEDNPCVDVRLPRALASTREGWDYLRAPEIDQLLTCEKVAYDARVVYAVAIYTGLRQGELWGLHWSDVTLEGPRPELVVRHGHRGPTKSGRIRHVPLFERAREALTEWRTHCPKGAEELVFPNRDGERRRPSDDVGWRTRTSSPVLGHRERAGIKRRVRFHDLRHTCASHLVMGTWGRTWRLEEVRDFLGHSSTKMTERYAHLSPDHLHRAAGETARGCHDGPEKVGQTVPKRATPQGEDIKRSFRTPHNASRDVRSLRDPLVTQKALALLAAVDGGTPAGTLAQDLAVIVLRALATGETLQERALDVLEGGPMRLRHAVDLAGLVLDAGEDVSGDAG